MQHVSRLRQLTYKDWLFIATLTLTAAATMLSDRHDLTVSIARLLNRL